MDVVCLFAEQKSIFIIARQSSKLKSQLYNSNLLLPRQKSIPTTDLSLSLSPEWNITLHWYTYMIEH